MKKVLFLIICLTMITSFSVSGSYTNSKTELATSNHVNDCITNA